MKPTSAPLFSFSGYYYTPSGKRSYVNGVTRSDPWETEKTHDVAAQVKAVDQLRLNPRRRYHGGFTFTSFEKIEESQS